MFCKELSFFGSRAFRPDEFPEILSLASKIKRKTALLITHHFSINQAEEAMKLFASGKTGKVVLHP